MFSTIFYGVVGRLAVLTALALYPGCASWMARQSFATGEPLRHTVYVVGHGWHTGLVIPRTALPASLASVAHGFNEYESLEIGWGDEGFYTAKDVTVDLAMRALFVPTPSVLHVVGFNGPVERYFSMSDIVEVRLNERRLHALAEFVAETFHRDSAGTLQYIAPGLYGFSRFYRADGSYYFPETCNVWTARALQRAGLPIVPILAITTESALHQAERVGRYIRRK